MLGARIEAFRRSKRLGVSELARRCGISASMITHIEHGKANPSIDVVRSIAEALEVPLFTLFIEEDASRGGIVRRDQRMKLKLPGSAEMLEVLTPDMHHSMVAVLACLPPGTPSASSPTTHRGEEFILVLRGALIAYLHDEDHLLQTGDSFYFDAQLPHYFVNASHDADVEFISAMTPPKW